MSDFFSGLWNSVFQPGTTPQLIIATHISFIALLLTLSWLIYATNGNIHFIALFLIALFLWLSIVWFIQELKTVKLKSNEELEQENKNKDKKEEEEEEEEEVKQEKEVDVKDESTTSGSVSPSGNLRSRKV